MKSKKKLLTQPSLHVLAATGAGMFVGWPVIHIAGQRGQWALFGYVFVVWLLLVLLLALIGRAIHRAERDQESAVDKPTA